MVEDEESSNRVSAAKMKRMNSWDDTIVTSLTDRITGEKLWFCPDTLEGCRSDKELENLVWMPLTPNFRSNMIDGKCLCLLEVQGSAANGFVRSGEKVYRQIGTGNFGRVPSML